MSWTWKRTKMDKPSISARTSAVSFGNLGGSRVLRTALRYPPDRGDEFSKCIEANLGSGFAESLLMNAVSARWGV
jgi:hypothetical protein